MGPPLSASKSNTGSALWSFGPENAQLPSVSILAPKETVPPLPQLLLPQESPLHEPPLQPLLLSLLPHELLSLPPPPQLSPDEPEPLLQLLLSLLEWQASQLPPQPLCSLELEHSLLQVRESLQLGPAKSQLGDESQLALLLLHALPQLTVVERGGSAGAGPPSGPGNDSSGAP